MKRFLLALWMLAAATRGADAAVIFVPIFMPQAAVLPGVASADYRNIHSVVVMSALGVHLNFFTNHFFMGQSHQTDISGLNLDDEIVARLKEYLTGRFTFDQVPHDRAALAAIPNGLLNNSRTNLDAFLKSLPQNNADAYIIVRQDLEGPGVEGLGLQNGGAFGKDVSPVIWANYEIDIVDAHTGKLINRAYSRLQLRDNASPSFAGMVVPDVLKVGDDFKLSDTQLAILRPNMSFLIHRSLVETLRAVNLGIDLPPPGAREIVPIPPDQDPYKSYKTVAVVSALGDQLGVEHLATILSHQKYQIPVPDWNTDTLVEQRVRAALAKRFTVVEPNVDRAAFAKATIWDEDGKLVPSFPGLSPASNVDLYVVVIKLPRPTWGIIKTSGLGVFQSDPPTAATVTMAYAHFAVVAIDAHTMKFLMASSGLTSPDRANPDPQTPLDLAAWPKNLAAPTPGEIAKFHDLIMDVLDDSVDETLLRLGLLGVVPTDDPPPPLTAGKTT